MIRPLLVAVGALALASCTSAHGPIETRPAWFAQEVSETQYAAMLDRAVADLPPGRSLLAVFGADWCHDSRALMAHLESRAMADLMKSEFDTIAIDVGHPQQGQGRNLDLAARYGVTDITGTPTLLVISRGGRLVNSPEDARSWRNAASRSQQSVIDAMIAYSRAD